MSEGDEKRFITRLKRRDLKAHRELVDEHGQSVFRFARSILKDHHEAEDIAQEVFVMALKRVQHFRGESSIQAWLFAITKNMCIDRQRYLQRRGRGSTEHLDTPAGQRLSSSSNVHARAVLGETSARAARALDTLPPEFREVIVLTAFDGLSYEEVAERTGVPVGTVRSRIARAREKLKRLMAEG